MDMLENTRTTSGLPDLVLDHENRIVRRGDRSLELDDAVAQWRLLTIVQTHNAPWCPLGVVFAEWHGPVKSHSIRELKRRLDPALSYTLGVRLHYDRHHGFQLQWQAGERPGPTGESALQPSSCLSPEPPVSSARLVCDAVQTAMSRDWRLQDRLSAAMGTLEQAIRQQCGWPRGTRKRAEALVDEIRHTCEGEIRHGGWRAVQEAEALAERLLNLVIDLELAISRNGKDQR